MAKAPLLPVILRIGEHSATIGVTNEALLLPT
jgi:hypothetical protein